MSDTAAHLIERVFPHTPVRQWVLALLHWLRFLIARSKSLCRAVRRVFARAVLGFMRRLGQREGVSDGSCSASIRPCVLHVHDRLLTIAGV
ncbi:MAG: hypothetical protein U1E76_15200 [Planctomycetota bacterium]